MHDIILDSFKKGRFEKRHVIEALLFKGEAQERLFLLARKKRAEFFPSEEVEVRSVVEISNVCRQECNFCNINALSGLKRYTINRNDLMKSVAYVYARKRRVLLLQSGENRSEPYVDYVSRCVHDIKSSFGDMIIILCMGNLSYAQYKQLREAGTDRYIIKFETSNPELYKQIKPGDSLKKRLTCLSMLHKLGYSTGSGNMIGLPGQSINDIAKDLLLIGSLKLKMASTSIFIPGEVSAYRDWPAGDVNVTLNYTALLRIKYPALLIPTTSSLEKAKKNVQYLGLMAGSNTVTIHDGTPPKLKKYFPIYSLKRVTPDEKYIRRIISRAALKTAPGALEPLIPRRKL